MKLFVLLFLIVITESKAQSVLYQLAFSGESTEEILKSLESSSSLALRREISNSSTAYINSNDNAFWRITGKGSVVQLNEKDLLPEGNSIVFTHDDEVMHDDEVLFYVHILKITPPNQVDLIFSEKIDININEVVFDHTCKAIKKFEY